MSVTVSSVSVPAPHPEAPRAVLSIRTIAGLTGIFIGAMMAGLNNRVGALGLADVRGVLGFGMDDASWLGTSYTVGELIATPFATWFAITLSVRRFHRLMLTICAVIAALIPFVHDLNFLIGLRFLQGISSGALIPILMMAALKFLPPSIRLHGLALYAMTATFAPNLAIWLAGQWTDGLNEWPLIYWQIIPVCFLAGLLSSWGLPHDRIQTERFKDANWPGMFLGVMALALIAIGLDQGVRLDWFNSPLITISLIAGLIFLAIYLVTEWFHHAPFLKLQLLARRNLWLGSSIFVALLVTLMSGAQLPANYLGAIQDYRALQIAPIGLLIALPQLLLGSIVALLLYQRRFDARYVFALGLGLIAVACFLGAQLTAEWNREQFFITQILQAVGQPMAIVSELFLMTSVVHASEGPYFSGTINTLRVFGTLIGAAAIGQLLAVRGRFHSEILLDHAGLLGNTLSEPLAPSQLMAIIAQQSAVLSVADAYRILGGLALLLIPVVLRLTYIPAPNLSPAPTHVSPSSSSHG